MQIQDFLLILAILSPGVILILGFGLIEFLKFIIYSQSPFILTNKNLFSKK